MTVVNRRTIDQPEPEPMDPAQLEAMVQQRMAALQNLDTPPAEPDGDEEPHGVPSGV